MGDEQLTPEQIQTIVNSCLEELSSSKQEYDWNDAILKDASTYKDKKAIAFDKMNEASRRYLAANDRLVKLGYQSEYDHEKKCYIARRKTP